MHTKKTHTPVSFNISLQDATFRWGLLQFNNKSIPDFNTDASQIQDKSFDITIQVTRRQHYFPLPRPSRFAQITGLWFLSDIHDHEVGGFFAVIWWFPGHTTDEREHMSGNVSDAHNTILEGAQTPEL